MRNEKKGIMQFFVVAIGVLLLAVFSGPAAWGDDPDLGDVDDMLDGRRTIGRADDLVLARPTVDRNIVEERLSAIVNNRILIGQKDAKWDTDSDTYLNTECWVKLDDLLKDLQSPFPQQTRIARLFNQKNDVLVTIAPTKSAQTGGCGGKDNMAFYVQAVGVYD
jgi:hypothetical protein